jgi:hypothetical protein
MESSRQNRPTRRRESSMPRPVPWIVVLILACGLVARAAISPKEAERLRTDMAAEGVR